MRLTLTPNGTAGPLLGAALALAFLSAAVAGPTHAADPVAADAADPAKQGAAKQAEELVPFKIEDGKTLKVINEPLGGLVGNAESGRTLLIDRAKGNCLACHAVAAIPELMFQGDVGTALDGIASRYTEAELRLILVDPKVNYPRTVMPAYYRIQGLNRVHPEFASRPLLNAQEVEDLLAFLMTLK